MPLFPYPEDKYLNFSKRQRLEILSGIFRRYETADQQKSDQALSIKAALIEGFALESKITDDSLPPPADFSAESLTGYFTILETSIGINLKDHDFLVRSIDDVNTKRTVIPAAAVICDFRSSYNAGAVLRSAECFGFKEVIFSGYSPGPEQAKTKRAAMGSEMFIPFSLNPAPISAITSLKEQGYTVYALEFTDNAADVSEQAWQFPCALIIGNERFGLSRAQMAACDGCVKINMLGSKASLNAAAAFTTAAHAVQQAWIRKGHNFPRASGT